MIFHKFILYAIIGASGTLLQYVILILLVSFQYLNAVTASSIGAIAGAILNYLLNYRFTFKSIQSHWDSAPKFFMVASLGFGVNWITMVSLVRAANINYLLAQFVSSMAVLLITYFANLIWSFSKYSKVIQSE